MDTPTATNDSGRAETKAARRDHPSGILHLFQHESVPILVDALLDLPPNREFTRTEFADHAGVTRQTVSRYVDLLVDAELVEPVPETSPPRYRLADGEVVRRLRALNGALNATVEDSGTQ